MVTRPPFQKPESLAKTAEKVAAASLEVHRQLGNGLDAIVYHRALALEFQTHGILFEREERIPIAYKERQIETRKVDFRVEGCLVEIVSQPSLSKEEITRFTNYLKASGYQLEVLLNFGPAKLDVRQIAVGRELDRPITATRARAAKAEEQEETTPEPEPDTEAERESPEPQVELRQEPPAPAGVEAEDEPDEESW
jgi:GxxExxY protein